MYLLLTDMLTNQRRFYNSNQFDEMLLVFVDGDATRDLDGVSDDDFSGIAWSDDRKSVLRIRQPFFKTKLPKRDVLNK